MHVGLWVAFDAMVITVKVPHAMSYTPLPIKLKEIEEGIVMFIGYIPVGIRVGDDYTF